MGAFLLSVLSLSFIGTCYGGFATQDAGSVFAAATFTIDSSTDVVTDPQLVAFTATKTSVTTGEGIVFALTTSTMDANSAVVYALHAQSQRTSPVMFDLYGTHTPGSAAFTFSSFSFPANARSGDYKLIVALAIESQWILYSSAQLAAMGLPSVITLTASTYQAPPAPIHVILSAQAASPATGILRLSVYFDQPQLMDGLGFTFAKAQTFSYLKEFRSQATSSAGWYNTTWNLALPSHSRLQNGLYTLSLSTDDDNGNSVGFSADQLSALGFPVSLTLSGFSDDSTAPVCTAVQAVVATTLVITGPSQAALWNVTCNEALDTAQLALGAPAAGVYGLLGRIADTRTTHTVVPYDHPEFEFSSEFASGAYPVVGMVAIDMMGNAALVGQCAHTALYQAGGPATEFDYFCDVIRGVDPNSTTSSAPSLTAAIAYVLPRLLLLLLGTHLW